MDETFFDDSRHQLLSINSVFSPATGIPSRSPWRGTPAIRRRSRWESPYRTTPAPSPQTGGAVTSGRRSQRARRATTLRGRIDRSRWGQREGDPLAHRPHGAVLRAVDHRAHGRRLGTAINHRQTILVLSTFDTGRTDPIEGSQQLWAINGLMRCNKNVRVVPFASSQS
jgi:hypothetical protein